MKANKFQSIFYQTLFGVILINVTLFAGENEEQSEPKHFPVGERAMSHVERVKIQEKRALLAHKIAKDLPLSEEDLANLSDAEQEEMTSNETENVTCCREHDQVIRKKGALKSQKLKLGVRRYVGDYS